MNLLKSQVQRQQQIEQVNKNVLGSGQSFNYLQVESKSSPVKSPPKKASMKAVSEAQIAMQMVK